MIRPDETGYSPETTKLLGDLDALGGKIDALLAEREELREAVRWVAQTVHQAHHQEQPGTFETCPKSTCDHAAKVLGRKP